MKTPITDKTIDRNVTQLLAGRGLRSPCHITVQSNNGVVTLTGTVLQPHQRDSATQVAQNVEGVRRVVDRLTIKPPVKQNFQQPAQYVRPPTDEEAAAAAEKTAAELAAAPEGEPVEAVVEAPKYDKQGRRIKEPAPATAPTDFTAKSNPYGNV